MGEVGEVDRSSRHGALSMAAQAPSPSRKVVCLHQDSTLEPREALANHPSWTSKSGWASPFLCVVPVGVEMALKGTCSY